MPPSAAAAMAASATATSCGFPNGRMMALKPRCSDSLAAFSGLSSSYPPSSPSLSSSSSAILCRGAWRKVLRGNRLPSRGLDIADQERRGEREEGTTFRASSCRSSDGHHSSAGLSAAKTGGGAILSHSTTVAAEGFPSKMPMPAAAADNHCRRGLQYEQGGRSRDLVKVAAAMAGGELSDGVSMAKSESAISALAPKAAGAPTAASAPTAAAIEPKKGGSEDARENSGGKEEDGRDGGANERNKGTLTCTTSSVQPAPTPSCFLRLPPTSLQYDMGVLGGISERTAIANKPSARSDMEKEEEEEEGSPTDPSLNVDQPLSGMAYLKKILTSKVYDVAIETPLESAPKLSERIGTPIFLKREDYQQVFSFKLRGAYNMMASLSKEQLQNGVIASSAGNHAQGVALAAKKLGCEAVICMPVTTPAIKWQSVKALGATVVLVGDAYDETQAYAQAQAQRERRTFIHPFDHPDVIAGQGTTGMEILRQHPGPLHAIFVPVGGGGLIAGVAAYVKRVRPEIRVIGVEPVDANAMALSMYMGQRVALEYVGGFADGVAVKMVGEETFRLCRELVDGVVLVTKDAICAAIKDVFEETRTILEPAGALALAGLKAYCKKYNVVGQSVVAITSGANMNFDRLRLVAQLADVGERKEAVLATQIPERPGSFKEFCKLAGTELNITEFKYRCSDKDVAHIMYSVEPVGASDLGSLVQRLEAAGFKTVDLTNNDLAKTHLRHLVGGSMDVPNEILYRFEFPERPGALMKFLDMVSPRWNISLFHYRAVGEERGHVLVGVQVLPEHEEEFVVAAAKLGYRFTDERNNEAFHMFVGHNNKK